MPLPSLRTPGRPLFLALLLFAPALAATPADNTAALHDWLDARYEEELAFSPETLTRLGRKERYGELDDYSAAADARFLDWYRDTVREMHEDFDRSSLDAAGRMSWDFWEYRLERLEDELAFIDHQYLFTQVSAEHTQFPQLLINEHAVDTAADMEAYIRRLVAIERALGQLLARARDAAARGSARPALPTTSSSTRRAP